MFQSLRKRSHNPRPTTTNNNSTTTHRTTAIMEHQVHVQAAAALEGSKLITTTTELSTAATTIPTSMSSEASPLLNNTSFSAATATATATATGSGNHEDHGNNGQRKSALNAQTGIPASFYVLSGVTQPLLMTLCKDAGLADSNCQLYMLFYYLGPASVGLKMLQNTANNNNSPSSSVWPSWKMMTRAGGITLFDITAQAMNYTGAALAGPTIFAIIYSSVTVWTAVFSRLLLKRTLLWQQWLGILIVFGGLALTATDHSVKMGSSVAKGLVLVMIGSALHGLCYVLCEVVMILSDDALARMPIVLHRLLGSKDEERLSVVQNCAIQGFFAVSFMFTWQMIYTVPHWEELILDPAKQAGTTLPKAIAILGLFSIANLIHALSYFTTLRYFPGGATSAGVMKGLQAVLVFVVTNFFFCGRSGGTEMCFSTTKLASLVTVVGGVIVFGIYTEKQHQLQRAATDKNEIIDRNDVDKEISNGASQQRKQQQTQSSTNV